MEKSLKTGPVQNHIMKLCGNFLYKVLNPAPTTIKQNHPRGTHRKIYLKKWLPMTACQRGKEKTQIQQNLMTDTWALRQPTTHIIQRHWQVECHLVYFGQILDTVYSVCFPRALGIGACARLPGLSSDWLR